MYIRAAQLGIVVLAIAATPVMAAPPAQPVLGSRLAPVLARDGLRFRDLNRNGRLDRYEDWRLPVPQRVADLVARMTVEEKAGMMMAASQSGFMGPGGTVMEALGPLAAGALKSPVRVSGIPGFDRADKPSPSDLILNKHVRWLNIAPGGRPDDLARWCNGIQEIAERDRLGIPAVIGSDPVQTTNRLPGGALPPPDRHKITSDWPDRIGLAAAHDPALVEEFGRTAAREARAMGMLGGGGALADVATDPRWNRIPGTFGEDAGVAATLTAAVVRGMQGERLGPSSALTTIGHFPGDGPVGHGLDPHNPYGKALAYPAGMQDYHLAPFRAAIAAGVTTIMTTYGIPTGLDTVGAAFSRKVVTDLLRDKLGFQGIIISDWLHAMPWGVENLSKEQRQLRMLDAGIDQFGGEHDPSRVIHLVRTGKVTPARLDQSMRRILTPMFAVGLFENPYVDPAAAPAIVNGPAARAAGERAQREAIVLLKNDGAVLPLKPGAKLFLQGFSNPPEALARHQVENVSEADILVVKVNAPYSTDKTGQSFFIETHQGSLSYAGADNAADLAGINDAAASGKPVIVVISMERPAVLSEFLARVPAVVATFGSGDTALADVLNGNYSPRGTLPFDLPADEASVEEQKEDAPHDFPRTLFRTGFGLTYQGPDATRQGGRAL